MRNEGRKPYRELTRKELRHKIRMQSQRLRPQQRIEDFEFPNAELKNEAHGYIKNKGDFLINFDERMIIKRGIWKRELILNDLISILKVNYILIKYIIV